MNHVKRAVYAAVMLTAVLPWAGCAAPAEEEEGEGRQEQSRDARPEEPVLRTQQFESGELRLQDVESERLEAFLRDLNRRRDYDFSQHKGNPGPDHAYLTEWVRRVLSELKDRGYYIDTWGDLHRPGPVVPTR